MLLVHAGNRPDPPGRRQRRFPADHVATVTARVERLLAALAPTAVISAPAAGADLIVLGVAQAQSIPVHVLLPLEADEFRRRSVVDSGDEWGRRFDAVLERATREGSSVERIEVPDGEDWLLRANAALVDLARRQGDPGEPVVALTIRPVNGDDPPSVTDDFAERAANAGWLVLTLDPRYPFADAHVG